jgi:hypothetical protein
MEKTLSDLPLVYIRKYTIATLKILSSVAAARDIARSRWHPSSSTTLRAAPVLRHVKRPDLLWRRAVKGVSPVHSIIYLRGHMSLASTSNRSARAPMASSDQPLLQSSSNFRLIINMVLAFKPLRLPGFSASRSNHGAFDRLGLSFLLTKVRLPIPWMLAFLSSAVRPSGSGQ